LAQFRRREPDNQLGHNEAGGWMVLLLLALLAAQVVTGLFAIRKRMHVEGPLAHTVDPAVVRQMSQIHSTLFYVLLAAIVLHVAAVAAYAVFKGHNLVRPMITGKKLLPAATRAPRMAPAVWALLVLALAAAAVALLVTQA
jgi:cytochrome b